jgi:hypothetical protein
VLREKAKTRWNINISVLFKLFPKTAAYFFYFHSFETKKKKERNSVMLTETRVTGAGLMELPFDNPSILPIFLKIYFPALNFSV